MVHKNGKRSRKGFQNMFKRQFLEEVKKLNIVSNVLNDQNVMIFS